MLFFVTLENQEYKFQTDSLYDRFYTLNTALCQLIVLSNIAPRRFGFICYASYNL